VTAVDTGLSVEEGVLVDKEGTALPSDVLIDPRALETPTVRDVKPGMPMPQKTPVRIGNRGVELNSLEEVWRFANLMSKTGWAPDNMKGPEQIAVAVLMGRSLGLGAVESVFNITVVKNRPAIYSELAKALVEQSGLMESFKEWLEGEGENRKAICVSVRRGRKPHRTEFSMKDAKTAGLLGKGGNWITWPDRMLTHRSRTFNLRDQFADVLKGLLTVEELEDGPVEALEPGRGVAGVKMTLGLADAR
jgi:hypothetical protein